jgi:putative ABC transport system permease protein
MIWLKLAWASAWARRWPMTLVVLGLGVGCALVLTITQLRQDARNSFSSAISGVDLVVGARGGPTDLLLYTVFHRGRASQNISVDSLAAVRALPRVSWALPLQMGDTYQGHPVVASEPQWFDRVQVNHQPLSWSQGRAYAADNEVVVGAVVATTQGLVLGQQLALTHGASGPLAQVHDRHLFKVVGILRPTGTPWDNTLMVSTEGFNTLHAQASLGIPDQSAVWMPPARPTYTALMVGLERRSAVFSVRRAIEDLPGLDLMAILPGVVLDDLWRSLSVVEGALGAMGWLVVLATALSLSASLMMSLEARRREMSILRSVGASPMGISTLLVLETLSVFALGLGLGLLITYGGLWLGADTLRAHTGIAVHWQTPSLQTWHTLASLAGLAVLSAAVPAWRALKLSLADGLNPPNA